MRRARGLAIWARFWLLEALPTRRWVEDILEAGGLGSESLAFICPSPSFWSFNILKEDLICESGNLLTKERADRDSAKLCDPGLREYSNGVWGPSPARDNVGPSSQALLVGSESRQRSFTYSRLVGSREVAGGRLCLFPDLVRPSPVVCPAGRAHAPPVAARFYYALGCDSQLLFLLFLVRCCFGSGSELRCLRR